MTSRFSDPESSADGPSCISHLSLSSSFYHFPPLPPQNAQPRLPAAQQLCYNLLVHLLVIPLFGLISNARTEEAVLYNYMTESMYISPVEPVKKQCNNGIALCLPSSR